MAVNYSAGLKTTRMQAVRDAIDAGLAAGSLEIGTAGMATVLVIFTLAYPASTVAGSILTFEGAPIATLGIADGIAGEARIKDSTGAIVASGLTVGLVGSGANVIMNDLNVSTNQPAELTSGQIIHG